MDQRVSANGVVDYWVIPVADLTNPEAPDVAELNAAAINLSNAIAWDGSTFPAASESNDVDDRSIKDRGNATSRGFAQFEAALNFFRPANVLETTTDYGIAFHFFRTLRVPVYLISRILQTAEGEIEPFREGELISVYKFLTSSWADDTEGEDSYKYEVGFLPQGALWVYTMTGTTNAIELNKTTLAVTVGASKTIRATLGDFPATQTVRWSSSNLDAASVSQNGVVTGAGAGSAVITASHPSGTSKTVTVTVT